MNRGRDMDLIDRYVVEVARHLPAKSAKDVAEELRSLLSDALEARAARTGRPKDELLAVELLREFGEPEDVAARYAEPKHLIGPDWYPVFESVAGRQVNSISAPFCDPGDLIRIFRFDAKPRTSPCSGQ